MAICVEARASHGATSRRSVPFASMADPVSRRDLQRGPPRGKIPRPTTKRLSLYLRELESRIERRIDTVSSKQLAEQLGLTDAQVRKDLACFGQFGHPGIGYRTAELVDRLRGILGVNRQWNAAVVGAGNIGRALMSYGRFRRKGFDIVAVFDNDSTVVGRRIGDHRVRPLADLARLVLERDIKIGIVAVPAEAAQEVALKLVAAGVQGILNFAPRHLEVPESIAVASVDFSIALEQLAFQISLGMMESLDE